MEYLIHMVITVPGTTAQLVVVANMMTMILRQIQCVAHVKVLLQFISVENITRF